MSDSKRYTFQTYEEFKREHPSLLEQNEELKARLGDALREVQALKAQVALLQQEHKAKVDALRRDFLQALHKAQETA